MEKTGEIKEGVTPQEVEGVKAASAEQLEDHVTKRAADTVQESMSAGCGKGNCGCRSKG